MHGRRLLFTLLCFAIWAPAFAQFSDDFSDGNFTANPIWSGEVDSFQISVPLELQSKGNSAAADIVYLTTPNALIDSTEWNFLMRLDFNPSSTNYARIYLVSNQTNLEGALNGYFIQLGEAGSNPDSIDLFRQDGLTVTKLLSGTVGCMSSTTTNSVRIRVTRDDLGNWELFGDCTGGNNLISQGTVFDNTHTATSTFGVYCRYSTASRFDKYFFDDFNVMRIVGDTTKPTLISASVISANQLDVLFSEPVDIATAQTAGNYAVNNGIGNPSGAVRDAGNFALVHLTFGTNFVSPTNYTLTVNNVQDEASNIILANSTANFTYFVAVPAVFKDVIINEIFADENPQVGLPVAEFTELYNRSANTYDLAGWKFTDGSSTATLGAYTLNPGAYVILCANSNVAAYSVFGPTLGVTSIPGLNNTGDPLGLRDNLGTLIDSVQYSDTWYQDPVKRLGGWSLELINPSDTCRKGGLNWIASVDPTGGTPGTQNSVFSSILDVTPPSLFSVVVTAPDTIRVCFDEPIVQPNISTLGNYALVGGSQTITAVLPIGPTNECVDLVLSAALSVGTQYILNMQNMEDCGGNVATLADTFVLGAPGARFEVIFNEIFPDPTPQVGLPNAEFVELYNRSASSISLAGWTFTDGSSTVTLPSHTMNPGDYLILTSTTNAPLFTGFGTVLGLSSLPSLNNDMDSLKIYNANGDLIDELNYFDAWYQDAIKINGGWTLERINPTDTCATGASNWIASNDPSGGTPGIQNSVYSIAPDITPPTIASLSLTGATTIQVCFTEAIVQPNIGTLGNYGISGGTQTITAASPVGNPAYCVDLTLSAALDTGVVYALTFQSMEDCAGNTASLTDTLVIGYPGGPNSLVINEIFPDPTPQFGLPGEEFVELYNISGGYLDLTDWTFTDGGSTATMPSYTMAPGEYLILTSTSNVSLFTVYGSVMGLSGMPGLNNDKDSLEVRNALGVLVNRVVYLDDWYQDITKEDGGFSLELINPLDTCDKIGNWIGSNDFDGGTPGRQNSVYDLTPDTQAPTMGDITVISAFVIQVCFDETMDQATLANVNNYSADNLLGTPLLAVPQGPDYGCVNLTFGSALDTGTVYTLTVTGLADCKGNIAGTQTGVFVLGGTALPGQIIITEFFPDYDPLVALPESEFVEIYNRGISVVNLAGYTFTDRTSSVATLPTYNLFPGEYLILSSTGAAPDWIPYGNTLALSSFPSLNNTSDSLELYTPFGLLMDHVYYSSSWYQDDVKADGGWTLERIDLNYPCTSSGNWRGSVDPRGGTPGAQNSVNSTYVDNEAPIATTANVPAANTIRILFNEGMDEATLNDPNNFSVDQGIGTPLASFAVMNALAVDLLLPINLDTNTLYCVTINGLQDCPGNTIVANTVICLGIPVRPEPGDIILNEILFNPYTGGSRFVELVNVSDKILDLQNIHIGQIDPEIDSLISEKIVTTSPRLLLPDEYVALTYDRQNVLDTYLPINPNTVFETAVSLPSYPDNEGECVILSDSGVYIDRFHYLDDYQFPNLDDDNGVSLERLSFTQPTQDANNWHSAASTVRYATPGYKNSQQIDPAPSDGMVWISPGTFSPDQDGFDDVAGIYYNFDVAGANVNVRIFDNRGRPVKTVAMNTLVSTEPGFFTWDGTFDSGRKADIGIYVVLVEVFYPSNGDKKLYKLPVVLAAKL